MNSLRSRAAVYGLIIVLGLLSALPNLFPLLPQTIHDHLPSWYSDRAVSLGLDLRGGSQLLLEADGVELVRQEHQAIASQLSTRLREQDIRHGRPIVHSEQVQIPIHAPALLESAGKIAGDLAFEAQ